MPRWRRGTSTFRRGSFIKADEYYTDLRKAYPTSEHQFLAHFLGMKAKLNSYQGPAYGGTVLDEAEKLDQADAAAVPGGSREGTRVIWIELRRRFAFARPSSCSSWPSSTTIARSIGRREHYYAAVAREFQRHAAGPAGRGARSARSPACRPVPEQQLPWLVALFPESDKVKPLLKATQQAQEATRRRNGGAAATQRCSRRRCSGEQCGIQNSEFRMAVLHAHSAPLPLLHSASAFCIRLGCAGYQLGQRSLYRPDIRTVHVPVVQSDSFRRYLGERLTEAVVKHIELKTPYKVVDSDSADSVLSMRLVSDSKRFLSRTPFNEPRDIETDFFVQVSWVDRRGDLIMSHEDVPAAPLW